MQIGDVIDVAFYTVPGIDARFVFQTGPLRASWIHFRSGCFCCGSKFMSAGFFVVAPPIKNLFIK